MDASNPMPESFHPSPPTPGGEGHGSSSDKTPARLRPTPISEDDAARLIAAAPVPSDPFDVLSRRGGRPMTDDQIAEFLCNTAGPVAAARTPDELPPLPTATVAARPVVPAPVLGYANRLDHDTTYSDPRYLVELPVAFRLLRVAPWVGVALFMLYAIIWKLLRG